VEDFPHLVITWWDQFHISGSYSYVLAKKLNLLKLKLKDWNRNVFGHLDTRMADLLEKLKLLDAKEQLSLTHFDRVQRFELKKELTLLCNRADIFWRQRGKQHWMQQGDQNTKIFHRVANCRRKFNTMRTIKVNGQARNQ